MQDVEKLTKACATCHGNDGVGRKAIYPNIGGQNDVYLLSALRNYQSGSRKNERMNAMIKDLNDKQLQDLAAYYSRMTRKHGRSNSGSE